MEECGSTQDLQFRVKREFSVVLESILGPNWEKMLETEANKLGVAVPIQSDAGVGRVEVLLMDDQRQKITALASPRGSSDWSSIPKQQMDELARELQNHMANIMVAEVNAFAEKVCAEIVISAAELQPEDFSIFASKGVSGLLDALAPGWEDSHFIPPSAVLPFQHSDPISVIHSEDVRGEGIQRLAVVSRCSLQDILSRCGVSDIFESVGGGMPISAVAAKKLHTSLKRTFRLRLATVSELRSRVTLWLKEGSNRDQCNEWTRSDVNVGWLSDSGVVCEEFFNKSDWDFVVHLSFTRCFDGDCEGKVTPQSLERFLEFCRIAIVDCRELRRVFDACREGSFRPAIERLDDVASIGLGFVLESCAEIQKISDAMSKDDAGLYHLLEESKKSRRRIDKRRCGRSKSSALDKKCPHCGAHLIGGHNCLTRSE